MFMSLVRGHRLSGHYVAALSWDEHDQIGDAHPAGQISQTLTATGLSFALTEEALTGDDVLASHACIMPGGGAFLRVDEVCFPVGAIAHRHTHAGAGIRHLVRGSLRLEADEHTQVVQVGQSWFEPANTPVRAVALHTSGVSSFVRAMIIPEQFEGQSTFKLVDQTYAALPRLQVTHRHIDLPL